MLIRLLLKEKKVITDELNTEKVVSRCETLGDGERNLSLVLNQAFDSPSIRVETVVIDLEPLETSDILLSSTGNFSAEE